MKETICAVVVTYNRLNSLKICLENLKKQTRKLDEIIVVNNGSLDGTAEWLSKQSDIYVINQTNLGSAGGFYSGIKLAFERNFDWIWCLDDDIFPLPDTLENLLKYSSISKCIHPLKKDVDDNEVYWENYFHPGYGKIYFTPNLSFKNGKNWCSVSTGCFEGMLIHKDIVKKVGYPDIRFFIDGDDLIYGFYCSLYTNVIYVKDAIVKKLLKDNKISKNRVYFRFRNFFLIREHLEKLRFWKRMGDFLFFVYIFQEILKSLKKQRFDLIVGIIAGVKDGLLKKFNKV
jgi:GT2 family glycosyltransferase